MNPFRIWSDLFEYHILAAVAFTVATACAITANLILWQMIAAINRHPDKREPIGFLFGYPGKYAKTKAEYKRLYPQSSLPMFITTLGIGMFGLMLITAWQIGFFG